MDVVALDAYAFEAERPRLKAIAARILGSETEADDVLQEAWIRATQTNEIEYLPAWLTTVVTRLCLDHLRKRRTRLSSESASSEFKAHESDPQSDALRSEQVDSAMQIVLDRLSPAERVAFVLHDVFAYQFDEISAVLGRSDTAVRQLASRARRKAQGAPEPAAELAARDEHGRVVAAFLSAARGGELTNLLSLLAPNVVMRADLVGQQMGTDALYDGAEAVAARLNGAKGASPVTIDGQLGAAWFMAGSVKVAFLFQVEAGLISEVELIGDPEVLSTFDVKRQRT